MMGNWNRKAPALLMLLALTGCATLPPGPSVLVLPAPGKPFEVFQSDDALCRQWAERQAGMTAQENYNENATTGAALGTVIGAGIGALFGAASGHPGAGAAIGAGGGLLFGTAAGADSGQVSAQQAQRQYDNGYVQCMYAKGNQVPGVARRSSLRRRGSTAPPPPADYNSVPPDYVPNQAPAR